MRMSRKQRHQEKEDSEELEDYEEGEEHFLYQKRTGYTIMQHSFT